MLYRDNRNKVEVKYRTNFQIFWDKAKALVLSIITGTVLLLLFLASMWIMFYFILFLAAFLFMLYIYNKVKNI